MTVLGIHAKTAGHVQIWLMTTAVPACQVTLERTVITVSQNMQLLAKPGAPDDSREQINFIKATENSIFTVTIRLILKLVNL